MIVLRDGITLHAYAVNSGVCYRRP